VVIRNNFAFAKIAKTNKNKLLLQQVNAGALFKFKKLFPISFERILVFYTVHAPHP
jgi:hypothetical protein